jgi:hypothetical protein
VRQFDGITVLASASWGWSLIGSAAIPVGFTGVSRIPGNSGACGSLALG